MSDLGLRIGLDCKSFFFYGAVDPQQFEGFDSIGENVELGSQFTHTEIAQRHTHYTDMGTQLGESLFYSLVNDQIIGNIYAGVPYINYPTPSYGAARSGDYHRKS